MSDPFTPWKDFYTLIGSSAAALTGLVFVMMTLIAGRKESNFSTYGASVFSSPTVVLFCAVLFIAGVFLAPWPSPGVAGTLVGVTGLVGVIYAIRIGYRTTQLESYSADPSDWMWFTLLPLLGSLAVCVSGFALVHVPLQASFALAGATMLLLFVGIHNAWDVIVYITIDDDAE
jgi:hypothetical protein